MSAQGRDWAEEEEHIEATAARSLARIRGWLRKHGDVRGNMYVHALEDLIADEPEPVLDAGWPRVNPVEGKMNR